ncbi:hypothetical protein [Marivirga arenosa]|uniref:Uncharacterized protein n=1 Tax=Marivirga arenosa TaxID=3059076 RepID=A0AA52F0H2_9BACT|nr:hypothetical protein [Marivirga sp. BKB1-2]WNB18862.1 hypothetical protein QYS47_31605 [Marivirga sp. BKB1-2]
MKNHVFIVLFFLIVNYQVKSQSLEQKTIGTKHKSLSNILNEAREFGISIPESYTTQAASHKGYPIIIILDGNTLFRAITRMVNYMSSANRFS